MTQQGYAIISQAVEAFVSGTHNLLNNEIIPRDASQDSLNWVTIDGVIQLAGGRAIVGNQGTVGGVNKEWFAYKIDGTKVHFRKAQTKFQVLIGSTWTDVITGLTANAKYTCANYASQAGTFLFLGGVDGIYKIIPANPTSYIQLKTPADVYCGFMIIDKGRSKLWNLPHDKTGLYDSYIDTQLVGTQYTAVTAEAIGILGSTNYSGTLAFKAGNPTANAFGGSGSGFFTATTGSGTETFVDNFDGTVTSNLGGTGTINYVTGAYNITFAHVTTGAVTANYLWENSNSKGLTDFTYGSPRAAGQGNVFRQDEGGDAIQQVLTGPDGKYYSMKSQSVYQLDEGDASDIAQTNVVFRKDIGVPGIMASVSTGLGIIFMNTANPSKPELTILTPNSLGDNLVPKVLFPQFKFSNYTYDTDTVVDFYDRFVLVSCKTPGSSYTDVLLIGDISKKTIQATSYGASSFAKDGMFLYGGSPLENSTYIIFNGFDDLNNVINNFWKSKGELFNDNAALHKVRRVRVAGLIDKSQFYEVWASFDDLTYQLIGTIRGDGTYVDYADPQLVGTNMVGVADVGGDTGSTVYPYFTEIKVGKQGKWRKVSLMFIAKGYGFVSIRRFEYWDLFRFENRIPSRFRQKQNVSLDGTQTDQSLPDH